MKYDTSVYAAIVAQAHHVGMLYTLGGDRMTKACNELVELGVLECDGFNTYYVSEDMLQYLAYRKLFSVRQATEFYLLLVEANDQYVI